MLNGTDYPFSRPEIKITSLKSIEARLIFGFVLYSFEGLQSLDAKNYSFFIHLRQQTNCTYEQTTSSFFEFFMGC